MKRRTGVFLAVLGLTVTAPPAQAVDLRGLDAETKQNLRALRGSDARPVWNGLSDAARDKVMAAITPAFYELTDSNGNRRTVLAAGCGDPANAVDEVDCVAEIPGGDISYGLSTLGATRNLRATCDHVDRAATYTAKNRVGGRLYTYRSLAGYCSDGYDVTQLTSGITASTHMYFWSYKGTDQSPVIKVPAPIALTLNQGNFQACLGSIGCVWEGHPVAKVKAYWVGAVVAVVAGKLPK